MVVKDYLASPFSPLDSWAMDAVGATSWTTSIGNRNSSRLETKVACISYTKSVGSFLATDTTTTLTYSDALRAEKTKSTPSCNGRVRANITIATNVAW